MRICLLDDDLAQLNLLGLWLAQANHTTAQFSSGRKLMSNLRQEGYDLFVLDWGIPDLDGTEVLRRIRLQIGPSVPVIFVTQRDFEEDVVAVLNAGADDYLVKPVRKGVFLARVEALLRRAYPQTKTKQLSFPPYEIDTERSELRRNGELLTLTHKEYQLAEEFFRNLGRVVSRTELFQKIWGQEGAANMRTIDAHVSSVRRKLSLTPESGFSLVPVYGFGYRLDAYSAASDED
jgi:DNA-binding response OmpR family regulator